MMRALDCARMCYGHPHRHQARGLHAATRLTSALATSTARNKSRFLRSVTSRVRARLRSRSSRRPRPSCPWSRGSCPTRTPCTRRIAPAARRQPLATHLAGLRQRPHPLSTHSFCAVLHLTSIVSDAQGTAAQGNDGCAPARPRRRRQTRRARGCRRRR